MEEALEKPRTLPGKAEGQQQRKGKMSSVEIEQGNGLHDHQQDGNALIEYRAIDVCHGGSKVLEDVSFRICEGEFVYLTGKVGSGKTSLMKTIYGELPLRVPQDSAQAPKADVLGCDLLHTRPSRIQELRRQMGIVFQDFQLLTDRSVKGNLDFVLRATGWKNKKEREGRIMAVLENVGMSQQIDAMPYELSGGEQQCVCIARALLNSPKLILADEATGNLDHTTGNKAAQLLYNICRNQGTAVLMSTHNEALMSQFPGRVMRCVQGRLAAE